MKEFLLLKNDYYQLSMCVAYILLDQANQKAGFEGFVRRINSKINPDQDLYYFGGNKEANELLETAKTEIQDPEFLETFISLVETKLPEDKRDLYIRLIRDKWEYLDKDFHYTVYPENAKLFPYVPAVQFYGAKWIGQLLETPLINTINGKTGFNTLDRLDGFDSEEEKDYLKTIMGGNFQNNNSYFNTYRQELSIRAKEYRDSTSKMLFEAGYRRACGFDASWLATQIALTEGWDGTSNTSIMFDNRTWTDYTTEEKRLVKIGGTIAHSFIMSHPTQLEALFNWNLIYPNSTILSCTYDVMECLELMIKYNIKPAMVRIDVNPLADLARQVRDRLDSVGWSDVKIFLSGDLTPEKLRKFEEDGVPFDACMAGTSYVNVGGTDKVNAEFVYKLVEFEKDGKTFYPEKKANGKDSKAGLKYVEYSKYRKTLDVTSHKTENVMDFEIKKTWMGFWGLTENNEIEEVRFIND
jgi:nicotinic acid phosphoribosyltransferase